MSEYWKSTPNYWCKFCKAFVRDTPIARQQHEQTGKHRGAVQRSLKNLHRDNEREERDKQRAKDEVARLNGLVSGKPSDGKTSRTPAAPQPPPPPRQAGPEERKLQMQQLADMGVAIPEQYRNDMALAGQWEIVDPPLSTLKQEDGDVKPQIPVLGVRKRRNDDEEEEEEDGAATKSVRTGWGSTFRSYPGSKPQEELEDIEALLNGGRRKKDEVAQNLDAANIKKEDETPVKKEREDTDEVAVKAEPDPSTDGALLGDVKKEDNGAVAPPVVFKKRKAKVTKPG